jgi:hypothetical protein
MESDSAESCWVPTGGQRRLTHGAGLAARQGYGAALAETEGGAGSWALHLGLRARPRERKESFAFFPFSFISKPLSKSFSKVV